MNQPLARGTERLCQCRPGVDDGTIRFVGELAEVQKWRIRRAAVLNKCHRNSGRRMVSMLHCMFVLLANAVWIATAYKWNESWYDGMPVDHFSYDVNTTFRLRYLINTEHWQPKFGPVFFYCGNEGNIEGFAENTGIWAIYLQKLMN
uniref:Uncharacterized protein n=1 Tax=Trichuris muris TaxID=70415 RepID=A0A5S6QJV8_TRIMR